MFYRRKYGSMYSKIAFNDLALLKMSKFNELPELVILAPSNKRAYGIKTGRIYYLFQRQVKDQSGNEVNEIGARDDFNSVIGTIRESLNPFDSIATVEDIYGADAVKRYSKDISVNGVIRAKAEAAKDSTKPQTTTLLDVQILQREIDTKFSEWIKNPSNFEVRANNGKVDVESSREDYFSEFGLS